MSLTLTSLEVKILKILLAELSEHQANSGCNDFEIPDETFSSNELSELRTKLIECNEDTAEMLPDNLVVGSYISDFELTGLLLAKAESASA